MLKLRGARFHANPEAEGSCDELALRTVGMNRLLIGRSDKTALQLHFLRRDFPTGVTLIDTTGQLAPKAANILPARLTQRAMYLDPSDQAYPVALDFLTGIPADRHQQFTEQVCATFSNLFTGGPSTLTRSNAIFVLANYIRALLVGSHTLLDVLKLLTDTSFRDDVLEHVLDPVVRKNWLAIHEKAFDPARALLHTQIGTLLMSPTIRNLVGQKRRGRTDPLITLANLDRAKIGDDTAKLLAGLLLARSPYRVVIADYGFLGWELPLAQERFTLALDFLTDLPHRQSQQVLGIEEKYVYRTNRRDAEELAFYVGQMNPRSLVDLGPGETLPFTNPEPYVSLKRLKPLKRRTRAWYSRPRRKVEETIGRQFLQ